MANSVLNAPQFLNEEAAFAYVESRLWPNGPVCPHCGNADAKRIRKMEGKTTRLGLHKCYECRRPVHCSQGTIFESSHLPLHLWLQVIHLMCASKKGISTNQIQRMLSLQHENRLVPHPSHPRSYAATIRLSPMGGEGCVVEIDETYIGRKDGFEIKRGSGHKNAVLTLVERGGEARSFHLAERNKGGCHAYRPAPTYKRESLVMTDEANRYSQAWQ